MRSAVADHLGWLNPSQLRRALTNLCLVVVTGLMLMVPAVAADGPQPLLKKGHPVNWWFVFKFNTASFPACSGGDTRICLFGGDVQQYKRGFGQQYVYASSEHPALRRGSDCAGDTVADPIGATFDEVYHATSITSSGTISFTVIPRSGGVDNPVVLRGAIPKGYSPGAMMEADS